MYGFINNSFSNNEFVKTSKTKYFVDKTKMIELTTNLIQMPEPYICITLPRRFGKTMNAKMLASYYSVGANFKDVFNSVG